MEDDEEKEEKKPKEAKDYRRYVDFKGEIQQDLEKVEAKDMGCVRENGGGRRGVREREKNEVKEVEK